LALKAPFFAAAAAWVVKRVYAREINSQLSQSNTGERVKSKTLPTLSRDHLAEKINTSLCSQYIVSHQGLKPDFFDKIFEKANE
jgi:hypothetical protein